MYICDTSTYLETPSQRDTLQNVSEITRILQNITQFLK